MKNLKPVLSFDYYDTFFCRNIFPIEEDTLEIVLPSNIDLKYKKFQTTITPQMLSTTLLLSFQSPKNIFGLMRLMKQPLTIHHLSLLQLKFF